MDLPLMCSGSAAPKLRRPDSDQALGEKKRFFQFPTMIILLILVNVWCTFLILHSFHLCVSSRKIDLYCISMGTGSRSPLLHTLNRGPEQVGAVIERLTGASERQELAAGAAVKPIEEQYLKLAVQSRNLEAVEMKASAAAGEAPAPAPAPDQGVKAESVVAVDERVEIVVDGGGRDGDVDYNISSVKGYMQDLRSWATKGAHVTSARESCIGRGIFIYQLPSKFNEDLVAQCGDMLPWASLCEYFANGAMGERSPELGSGWYRTHQYLLEPIFHARISNHPCRVYDHSAAKLFYVPYYAGLDVLRWHFKNASAELKDALGSELLTWLAAQPSWARRAGADHMFVLGKISWDFRRTRLAEEWGSNFLLRDEMRAPYKFLIERHPWETNEVGVPHPTHFHPRSDADIVAWQMRITSGAAQRRNLVCFAGAARDEAAMSIRSELIRQCTAADGVCRFLDCAGGGCTQSEAVVGLFMESEFCLQPPGDSPTRKSVFDSLVAGCIPVLFNQFTAYYQYPWHLPDDHQKYSVFIDEREVKEGKADVMERLRKISAQQREEMRRFIVHQIMPGLVYGDATARFDRFRDAFDIIVDNVIEKVIVSE